MSDKQEELKNILDFLQAPEDEYVMEIDCSSCDTLAALAEQVASGTPIQEVLPALAEHVQYWRDCREEFEALVAVLKAEDDGTLAAALNEITDVINKNQG